MSRRAWGESRGECRVSAAGGGTLTREAYTPAPGQEEREGCGEEKEEKEEEKEEEEEEQQQKRRRKWECSGEEEEKQPSRRDSTAYPSMNTSLI